MSPFCYVAFSNGGFCGFFGFVPGRIFLWPLHGGTCEDEKVIAHKIRGKIFDGHVRDPVMDLVVTRRDKSALIAVI